MDVVLDQGDAAAWQAAAGPALQQSWWYGAAAKALGRQVLRARLSADGQDGAAQVLARRLAPGVTLGLIQRGPHWHGQPCPEMQRRALTGLRRALPGPLRLFLATPETPVSGLMALVTPTWLAELPLYPDVEALRAGLHGKWRNRLCHAERQRLGATMRPAREADLTRLAAREAGIGRALGYRPLPPAFLMAWHRAGGAAWLVRAGGAGASIAEMLFLDHPPGVTYQIGWTSTAGRAASAHHLLLWHAIAHFAGAGRTRLDLGTLDTHGAPGLARFKLGTGAGARATGPSGLVLI